MVLAVAAVDSEAAAEAVVTVVAASAVVAAAVVASVAAAVVVVRRAVVAEAAEAVEVAVAEAVAAARAAQEPKRWPWSRTDTRACSSLAARTTISSSPATWCPVTLSTTRRRSPQM